MLHPEVAGRSCEDCQQFIYDEIGEVRLNAATGEKVPRIANTVIQCQKPEGCPMGTPDSRRDLSLKNRMAWSHYQECAAVGRFPHDGIVERNAGLFKTAEQVADRARTCELIRETKATSELLLAFFQTRG